MAPALLRLPRLERLFLIENDLGGAGARALAEVLPRLPRLAVLEAMRCNLGDAPRAALRDAAMPTLRVLRL